MRPLTLDQRTDIATRLTAGQTPKAIALTLSVGVKTVYMYHLRKLFQQPDGTFVAVASSAKTKEAFPAPNSLRFPSGWKRLRKQH